MTHLKEECHNLRRFLRENHIDSLLLGLSGGPDSVAAFHLIRMATEGWTDFHFGIAHANFHLRGEESRRDEEMVRHLLGNYPGIESHFTDFDTTRYCRHHSISIEMGARQLRHEWFDTLCRTHGYSRIATGHNADDNEETLLLNLLRGSGSRGLRGMEHLNERIFRPLLHLSRREILELLQSVPDLPAGLPPYVTDSTNLSADYRRNFLRHRVIPLLGERWEGVHTALQTTLRLMNEENRIVEYAIRHALQGCDSVLPRELLLEFPSPLSLLRQWLQPLGATATQIAEMAGVATDDAFGSRAGARWLLPEWEVTVTPAGLRRAARCRAVCPPEVEWEALPAPDAEMMQRLRRALPTEAYLPDSPESYHWRHPRPGERFAIGHYKTKLITDLLKEAGIASSDRPHFWLLATADSADTPLWLPGLRRAMLHLITPEAQHLWHVQLPRNK